MLNLRSLFSELERVPQSLFLFLFRLAVAIVFWNSGQSKLSSWDITLTLFRDEYRVPILPYDVAAIAATGLELVCPILLLIGLASRLATLPLIGMTLVIQLFVYPEAWVVHLTWMSMLLFVLTRGPGTLSLDHLIARRVWA